MSNPGLVDLFQKHIALHEPIKSEVAALLQHIDEEARATQQGLSRLRSAEACHAFIETRIEHIKPLEDRLYQLTGPDATLHLIITVGHALGLGASPTGEQ